MLCRRADLLTPSSDLLVVGGRRCLPAPWLSASTHPSSRLGFLPHFLSTSPTRLATDPTYSITGCRTDIFRRCLLDYVSPTIAMRVGGWEGRFLTFRHRLHSGTPKPSRWLLPPTRLATAFRYENPHPLQVQSPNRHACWWPVLISGLRVYMISRTSLLCCVSAHAIPPTRLATAALYLHHTNQRPSHRAQSPCVLAPVSPGCQWSFPIQSSGDTYPLGIVDAPLSNG